MDVLKCKLTRRFFIHYFAFHLEVCDPPSVQNGYLTDTDKTLYKYGDKVTIICNPGYVAFNSDATCMSDRTWSPVPSCTYVSCQLPSITNGYYTKNAIRVTTTQSYGDVINPVCVDVGFTPSPSTPRTCQANGQWSGQEPTCAPQITCTSLPEITNGQYDDGGTGQPLYYYNHAITPICNNGYYIDGPTETRRCIANNTWSGNDVDCLRIICSPPNPTINGQYNESQQTYDYGSVLALSCDIGYYVSNNAGTNRKCEAKDTWSGYDPVCQRITCSPPNPIIHGQYDRSQAIYDFESIITPICKKGFKMLNNVIERVCEGINKWSGDEPQCTLVTCNKPASFGNGWLTPNQQQYDYNTTIELSCHDGYEVKDGTPRRTCFEDGSWGDLPLQCIKIICNDTSYVKHQSINEYPRISFGEVGNVTYNYSFFHLKDGSTEVNCSANRAFLWKTTPDFGW